MALVAGKQLIDVAKLPPFYQCVNALHHPGPPYLGATEYLKPGVVFNVGAKWVSCVKDCAIDPIEGAPRTGAVDGAGNCLVGKADAQGNCPADAAVCPGGFKTAYP